MPRAMGASVVAFLAISLAPRFGYATLNGVTPIEKVLQMLGGMLEKAKAGKHDEMVEWSAFKTFCTDTELQKQTSIQEADVQKEKLKAEKEKHDEEVTRLTKEISDHETDIKDYKDQEETSTKDREAEHKTYETTHADYSESIQAITDAIAVLKKRAVDVPQATSLLQAIAAFSRVPPASKRAIDNYLSLGDMHSEVSLLAAPEANAYEFQSTSIITMLEELKDKFLDEKTALEKNEMISRQAYESVMLDLRNSIKAAENEIRKKSSSKADNAQGSVEAKKLFGEVSTARDDDQTYLTDLTSTCQQKSADFESRQKLRDEEIEAITKAIDIIGGDAVGAASKHLPSLLQERQHKSLVQFLSTSANPSNQEKAVAFLKDESQRLQSHVLSAIVLQASSDPFVKVKKMIQDLITRLQEQAEAEAEHKEWCDDELKTNGQTRKDKSSEVETLTSDIDQLQSRLAVLKKDLAVLSKEIAEIVKAVAEAQEIRTKEKESNDKTIAEAVEGQTAIAQAQKILKDFYAKAGESTVLAQGASKQEPPPIFDAAYKGEQKQNNNVQAFLDVIASDFMRLETDTKKAESSAQAEYDDFMATSDTSKKAKEKEEDEKKKEQLEKTGELSTKQDDLESAQQQLDAALAYYDKLKPSCINAATPYNERVMRREDEIAALKEALEILNGEGLAPQPDALYSSTEGGNLAVEYK